MNVDSNWIERISFQTTITTDWSSLLFKDEIETDILERCASNFNHFESNRIKDMFQNHIIQNSCGTTTNA